MFLSFVLSSNLLLFRIFPHIEYLICLLFSSSFSLFPISCIILLIILPISFVFFCLCILEICFDLLLFHLSCNLFFFSKLINFTLFKPTPLRLVMLKQYSYILFRYSPSRKSNFYVLNYNHV